MTEDCAIDIFIINNKMGVQYDKNSGKITHLDEEYDESSQEFGPYNLMIMDSIEGLPHDMMKYFGQMFIRV